MLNLNRLIVDVDGCGGSPGVCVLLCGEVVEVVVMDL